MIYSVPTCTDALRDENQQRQGKYCSHSGGSGLTKANVVVVVVVVVVFRGNRWGGLQISFVTSLRRE